MSRAQLTSTVEQNTGGAVSPYAAGKNVLINGALDVWQRGTSFSGLVYTADRWQATYGNSVTVARSTDTPNSAFLYSAEVTGSNFATLQQRLEGATSRQFVGQNVTISFWAKATASVSLAVALQTPSALDNWSSASFLGGNGSVTATTSWTRFSFTIAAANLTSAAANGLALSFNGPTGAVDFKITGIQMEQGLVATAFQTATGTLSGELMACQRYYWRTSYDSTYTHLGSGIANTTTALKLIVPLPVQLRTVPSSFDWAGSNGLMATDGVNNIFITAIAGDSGYTSKNIIYLSCTASGFTQFRSYQVALGGSGNTTQYLGCSAEL